ncbi:MAG: DNA polymerase-4 [Saprospiraceae bacterium]|jgi:DNA polymerase-4
MDAFYASVEQRDYPELLGKPIAVGGGSSRGVLTTCSYEARKFGVRSAMPGYMAKKLCPHIIFMPVRFDAYREVSKQIREIFYSYTSLVEPLSLDEAFLDITDYKPSEMLAMDVAQEIKDRIQEITKLTASAGVSYCKFMAKIASDIRKPDGLTVIHPDLAERFIEGLPIEKFFGVGKVTAKKMKGMNIHTGADLKDLSQLELVRIFGKYGNHFYNIVRGIDESPVRPDRKRKSQAVERTLSENAIEFEVLESHLSKIMTSLMTGIEKSKIKGFTLTLKLKFADFQIITRSKTFSKPIVELEFLRLQATQLLKLNYKEGKAVRLIGLTISNFKDEKDQGTRQLSLDI